MAQMAKTAAPKGPEQPSYGNFGKVTQNPHFLKKYKVQKHSGANGIIPELVCT